MRGAVVRAKSYPRYKSSGAEYFGSIPEHWVLRKIKHLAAKIGSGKTPKGGAEVYVDSGVMLLRSQNVHFGGLRLEDVVFIDSEVDAEMMNTRVRHGDVLLNITGASLGRCCLAGEELGDANVNQHVCIIRPMRDAIHPEYLCAAMCSHATQSQVFATENGTSREGLNFQQVGNLILALPPDPTEQDAIACAIRTRTRRIDALIAKKQRQIELLQEKRAALISHSVTKGLDPTVKMKDSSIEWLGRIPAHWSMKRLKFVAALQTGLTLGKKYEGENLVSRPYLRVANVQDGYLDLNTITEVEMPPEDVHRYELQAGDVLMTEGGDFDKLGRGYVWENQIPGCLHQNHIFAVRPRQKDLRSTFLAAMLTSSHGKNYFTSTSQQTTNLATTNSTKLLSLPVPLPPLNEQDAILDHIGKSTNRLDSLVRQVRGSIEKLQEYRTALISAAVTGKIDVREEVA